MDIQSRIVNCKPDNSKGVYSYIDKLINSTCPKNSSDKIIPTGIGYKP